MFSLSTNASINNDGLLLKSAGNGVSSIQTHFRNAGTVEVRMGTLEFYGSYALTHIQTEGQTILNGGNIDVTSPGVYQLLGGDLLGTGRVTGTVLNSGGTVKPGLSAGLLNIAGAYTQAAGGSLEIELGGSTPGIDFDQLSIAGVASLGGTLRVGFIGGFSPTIGEQFIVLTAGNRTGTFATVEPLTPGPPIDVTYGPNSVTLQVSGPSPDLNRDGVIDLVDFALFQSCFGGPGEAPPSGCGAGVNADLDVDGDVDHDDYGLWFVALPR